MSGVYLQSLGSALSMSQLSTVGCGGAVSAPVLILTQVRETAGRTLGMNPATGAARHARKANVRICRLARETGGEPGAG
jgi:hypothetical protein